MRFFVEHKKSILIIIGLAVAGLVTWTVYYLTAYNASLVIKHTPQDASVIIDGRPASVENRIKPGDYTISVVFDGFTTYRETIYVASGQEAVVYAILEPKTERTANWYSDNASDGQLREQLLDERYIQDYEAAEAAFPIMSILPYIPPRGVYQIHYGMGTEPNTQAVYISYYSEEGKQLAEEYITDNGFKLEDYEIIYKKQEFGVSP